MKHVRMYLIVAFLGLPVLAFAENGPATPFGPDVTPAAIAPITAPFEMPELTRPVFPNRQFDIREYGATVGGEAKNTGAFAAAIAACHEAGGGTVVVPPGVWLTGAIHLRSNVNLYLAAGSLIVFSDDPEDYLPVVFTRWAGFELYNYSPLIYVRDAENIAITGPGGLDGNGERWWPWVDLQSETIEGAYESGLLVEKPVEERIFGTPEAGLRPQFVNFVNCRNILLEGFRIAAPGPFWTIHMVYSDHIIVRGLQVYTYHDDAHNCDGLNIDSSTNVLIEHCLFDTKDDCICMKAGINEDGLRVGRPTENVVIRHIITGRGHGGAVFGSDTSGWIRNVYVHNCVYDGTLMGIRFKSTRGRGGGVENIHLEDIVMKDITRHAIVLDMAYRAWFGTEDGIAPTFRNVHIHNVSCNGARFAVRLVGLPESPVADITLANVAIRADRGMFADEVKNLTLDNVTITTVEGPAMELVQVEHVNIQ